MNTFFFRMVFSEYLGLRVVRNHPSMLIKITICSFLYGSKAPQKIIFTLHDCSSWEGKKLCIHQHQPSRHRPGKKNGKPTVVGTLEKYYVFNPKHPKHSEFPSSHVGQNMFRFFWGGKTRETVTSLDHDSYTGIFTG